jgi:hypothetical protein
MDGWMDGRVLTVGEVEELLQDGRAAFAGKTVLVERAGGVAFAGPCGVRFGGHLIGGGGFGVAG